MPTSDERTEILRCMSLAVRAAEVMLGAALSVSEVEEAARRVVTAVGLPGCEVSVTLNTITLSYLPPDLTDTFTIVRVVDVHATRLDRLTDAHALIHRLERGEVSVQDAYDELERIATARDLHSPAVRFLGGVVSAGGWVLSAGGGAVTVLIGFVIGALAVPLYAAVERSRVPDLFGAIGAAAIVASLPWLAGAIGMPVNVVAATAGGLYPLLPGGALIASVRDGLSGAPISSMAKGLQASILAVGLAVGVLGVLSVVRAIEPSTTDPEAFVSDPARGVGVVFALVGLALVRDLPWRLLPGTVGIGMVAWAGVLAAPGQGIGREGAAFVAAAFIGVGGRVLARGQHASASAYTGIAVLVLAPGLRIYGAMLAFASGDTSAGGDALVDALRIAAAVAAGVAAGLAISRPPRPRRPEWIPSLRGASG
jgi:uncharacterized membrane protein YjjP (DUF1212 family)